MGNILEVLFCSLSLQCPWARAVELVADVNCLFSKTLFSLWFGKLLLLQLWFDISKFDINFVIPNKVQIKGPDHNLRRAIRFINTPDCAVCTNNHLFKIATLFYLKILSKWLFFYSYFAIQ